MAKDGELGVFHYVSKAFTWQWNLLVLGGAVVASLISGHPDIAIPLVLAAEGTYLAAMTANRKFRKSVEAQHHKALKEAEAEERVANRVQITLDSLYSDRRERFLDLKRRCQEMQRLAAGVRGDTLAEEGIHRQSLEKMLWVFLRLLVSQQALLRFVETTDHVSMRRRVSDLEKEIKLAQEKGKSDKIVKALVDSLATAQLRVDNVDRADENAQFVRIELNRIEDKIKALIEMSVAHEDPDFITDQVDSVAQSISHTEQVMRDMQFVPGVEELDDEVPALLSEAG